MDCAAASWAADSNRTKAAETCRSARIVFLPLFFLVGQQQTIGRRKAQDHILAQLIGGVTASADDTQRNAVHIDDIVGLRTDEALARHLALEGVHARPRRISKLDMLGP